MTPAREVLGLEHGSATRYTRPGGISEAGHDRTDGASRGERRDERRADGGGAEHDHRRTGTHLTTRHVWRALGKASFAVVGYVTPSGARVRAGSLTDRRAAALRGGRTRSWKAKHIAVGREVAVTVPVRRGGILALVAPIPPATVSFHATAIVHPPGAPEVRSLLEQLTSLLPVKRQDLASVAIIPTPTVTKNRSSVTACGRCSGPASGSSSSPVS